MFFFFFSSRRRHTRYWRDWSSDVCSSDLDAFNQVGQNWSQPPWRPDQLDARGYAPFRDLIAAVLRHAGGVRVDHIIGLFRLWWIPEGRPPSEGTYVRYDHEAMVGVLA